MIVEGLITTLDPDGSPHLAPMGPRVSADFTHFTIRPFPTSRTYLNLLRQREGVFHVTDNALMLARAAIGPVLPFPQVRPADRVQGVILIDSCRHFEFVVGSVDTSSERAALEAEVVCTGWTRNFLGFNRAKSAVLEAAILATRLHLLPLSEVVTEFRKLQIIVGKTGGPDEFEAMSLLETKLQDAEKSQC